MILQLHNRFEGYTPYEVLSTSASYREVYIAKDDSGGDVCLTVYDLNAMTDFSNNDRILEFEIIPKLTSDVLPTHISHGHYTEEGKSLRWMVTKYVGRTTLSDLLCIGYPQDLSDALHQFYQLLVGVKEISLRIGDGCHNNLSTDNIIISDEGDGELTWHLTALNCISKTCLCKATFDLRETSIRYCAPETLIGHYTPKTDIFALGILLAHILQKKHPWSGYFAKNEDLCPIAFTKYMRENEPVLEIEEPLRSIVAKAIETRPSKRYNGIEDFGDAIAKYLGEDNPKSFECFTRKHSTQEKTTYDSTKRDDMYDSFHSHAPGQPKTTIKIERAKGNGFKDVAGMEQLKGLLTRNFVSILQNRELAKEFQITPSNLLLYGPPGTGKSFICTKLAEQTGMLYAYIKPSDLGNIYVHGTQKLIADIFTRSKELAAKNKCGVLLVFDEFDCLAPKRTTDDNSNQANEVGELLTQLNDCVEHDVYVVATTNRIEAIDNAVLRAGRLDEIIYVGLPDDEARKALFELELSKRPHDDININNLVAMTKGYTSSDISYIVKESARCSFDASINSKSVVAINQSALECVIKRTRPSVSCDELREYERMRDSFIKGDKARPRIGY